MGKDYVLERTSVGVVWDIVARVSRKIVPSFDYDLKGLTDAKWFIFFPFYDTHIQVSHDVYNAISRNVVFDTIETHFARRGGGKGRALKMLTFETLSKEIGKLVTEKNKAYGDSFSKTGQILKILYPGGIKTDQLDDALTIARVIDKLFRIATDKDAFGESPWKDICGYGLLGWKKDEEAKRLNRE